VPHPEAFIAYRVINAIHFVPDAWIDLWEKSNRDELILNKGRSTNIQGASTD